MIGHLIQHDSFFTILEGKIFKAKYIGTIFASHIGETKTNIFEYGMNGWMKRMNEDLRIFVILLEDLAIKSSW